jgi:hypothetical protein
MIGSHLRQMASTSIATENPMHNRRVLRTFAYGAPLALLVALSAPDVPTTVDAGVAFAQDTGQPSVSQTPTPTTGTSTGATAGSGQQPGVLVPVSAGFVPAADGAQEGFGDTVIEEGDDIGEGLSNQRHDPDD